MTDLTVLFTFLTAVTAWLYVDGFVRAWPWPDDPTPGDGLRAATEPSVLTPVDEDLGPWTPPPLEGWLTATDDTVWWAAQPLPTPRRPLVPVGGVHGRPVPDLGPGLDQYRDSSRWSSF